MKTITIPGTRKEARPETVRELKRTLLKLQRSPHPAGSMEDLTYRYGHTRHAASLAIQVTRAASSLPYTLLSELTDLEQATRAHRRVHVTPGPPAHLSARRRRTR